MQKGCKGNNVGDVGKLYQILYYVLILNLHKPASAFDVHEIYYWYFSLCISKELKVGVCGSQIVGLVPLEAMLMAADYYIEKENLFILSEDQKIRLVCLWLFYLRDNSF